MIPQSLLGNLTVLLRHSSFPFPSGGSDIEESAYNTGDLGLIPESRSHGEGNG